MQSFNLKILTPDGVKFDGQAQSVTLRGDTGDVTILARHIDYVTALGIGKAKVVNADGQIHWGACNGGVLSVMKGEVRVLATTFEWQEEIDDARALRSLEKGKKLLAEGDGKSRTIDLAKLRIQRALTRDAVAKMNDKYGN